MENPYYEPGYEKRKKMYNYPVSSNASLRTIEIFVPLRAISGWARDFDRATENMPITVRLHRNPTSKYKSIFGAAGTDMDFQITSMQFEILQVEPNDKLRVEFNRAIEKEIEMGYMAGWSTIVHNNKSTDKSNYSINKQTRLYICNV